MLVLEILLNHSHLTGTTIQYDDKGHRYYYRQFTLEEIGVKNPFIESGFKPTCASPKGLLLIFHSCLFNVFICISVLIKLPCL